MELSVTGLSGTDAELVVMLFSLRLSSCPSRGLKGLMKRLLHVNLLPVCVVTSYVLLFRRLDTVAGYHSLMVACRLSE